MNPLFLLVLFFSACVGFLISDSLRGAIVGVTIFSGISILINLFYRS